MLDSNHNHADIITPAPFVRQAHQPCDRLVEIRFAERNLHQFFIADMVYQTIRSEQYDIARFKLFRAGIDINRRIRANRTI